MTQIDINLDNLTQAHIEECRPKLGRCTYVAPCIIGTLMPAAKREDITGSIGWLASRRLVTLPRNQREEAIDLQHAFDCKHEDRLRELLAKRGLTW